MVDDNKKHPFQDDTANQGQDQQKGGEATATDQDLADVDTTDIPTVTSEDTDMDTEATKES
jgi:hypothetical protein